MIRGEEWAIKKVETNSFGNQTIHAVGLSTLVKDKPARFLVDLEADIQIVDPLQTQLIVDDSHFSAVPGCLLKVNGARRCLRTPICILDMKPP